KSEILSRKKEDNLLVPIEDIQNVKLKEVFVEPIITDTKQINYTNSKNYSVEDILKSEKNIVLSGGEEFGKTTLLNYIKDTILDESFSDFNDKIPVFINFVNLPKNNYKSIKRIIRKKIDLKEEKINDYLENGNFVLLIDDYNDFNDEDREKKRKVLKQIYKVYSKCKFVISITEKATQSFSQNSFQLKEYFDAEKYFLSSFNTAKIRELLNKWNKYKNFDVDKMLKQILYYFNQLKIPVTPRAVTLFIGVLFRDMTANKNIKNEAYLIENYSDELLQNFNYQNKFNIDRDDVERFLANIALRMVEKDKFEWKVKEFKKEKINYFDYFNEDLPNDKVFKIIFNKGILKRENERITFKFKFWFHFYLAKAMGYFSRAKEVIMKKYNYLKFSNAIGYKAGLDRDNEELLKEIDNKIHKRLPNKIFSEIIKELESGSIDGTFIDLSEEIEEKIKENNSPEAKDSVRDDYYLDYDETDQEIKEEDYDNIINLITLHSNIIRNTTKINSEKKKKYISKNVSYYIQLIFLTLKGVKDYLEEMNEQEIKKTLFSKGYKKNDINFDNIINRIKEFVFRMIPLSALLYMTDHLSNSKLKNDIIEIIERKENIVYLLFYILLLFKMNFKEGIKYVINLVNESGSNIIDYIVYMYLRFYCKEKKLEKNQLEKIINILEKIKDKQSENVPKKPFYNKDTFSSDMRKKMLLDNYAKEIAAINEEK
ncbi:MAG: NACHT domain-containing protein, partial [archaeon]